MSQTENSASQDLSTVLWLFCSLRVHNQHAKVYSNTFQAGGVFGVHCEHQYNDSGSSTSQDHSYSDRSTTSATKAHDLLEVSFTTIRKVSGHQTSSLCSTIALPCSSAFKDIINEGSNTNFTKSTVRPYMVAITIATQQLLPYFTEGGINSHRVRCFNAGVGSNLLRCDNQWSVDSGRSSMSHQYSRIESSFFSNTVFSDGGSGCQCPTQIGQSDSNSIFESHGRSIINTSVSSCNSDLGMVPCLTDRDSGRIFTWGSQHYSRLGITPPSRQQQLAVIASNFRCSEPPAGHILY